MAAKKPPQWIDVHSQEELTAVLAAGDHARIKTDGEYTVYGTGVVEAFGSSTVWAFGSSTVWAYGSSTVRAFGSSTVWADGSSTVRAFGSSTVTAGKYVAVHLHNPKSKVTGGVQIAVPVLTTVEAWCDYYGLEIKDGQVVLFKAVDQDFMSPHNTSYKPGTTPKAPDWDGGKDECGGGLHFSPYPIAALEFVTINKPRFVACPINIADLRTPKAEDQYPNKLKASKVAAAIWECDPDGNPLLADIDIEIKKKAVPAGKTRAKKKVAA